MIETKTPSSEQPKRRSNVYGVIACQGDSLTFGSRDPDGMSYPLYLGRMLSQKHGQTWVAVNFGDHGGPNIFARRHPLLDLAAHLRREIALAFVDRRARAFAAD